MTGNTKPDQVAIGIDLGGTATRFVSLDARGHVWSHFVVGTPAIGSADELGDFVAEKVVEVAAGREVASVGVGASGPIDANGVIQNPATLPAFTGVDLLPNLQKAFDLQPVIDNDAVTAAIGEARLGAGRSNPSMLMITLGTGVGVCLLQEGQPFRAADGSHPEAGHLSIGGADAPCYCGRLACWEQVASRRALQASSSALFDEPLGTAEDIDRAAQLTNSGDGSALAMFTNYGRRLAEGLSNLISAYGANFVVIGGSGSNYLPFYGPAMREHLLEIQDCFPIPIVGAQLGADGGAIGAALLGRQARSIKTVHADVD
jgi:glucokinase